MTPARRTPKTTSPQLADALKLHKGARFYKCALQVNPYGYLKRHGKSSAPSSEAAYNAAIVTACLDNKILENKDATHKRERPVAVINASDVNAPDDLAKEGATTFIKMSAASQITIRSISSNVSSSLVRS